MSNRPKKNKKLNMPLLGELSRSSLELFESNGKVDQIQGRLASFVQKWRFQVLVFFSNVEPVDKKQKIEHATFWRIKPIVLGFVRIEWESGPNPRTIGFICSKVAFSSFSAGLGAGVNKPAGGEHARVELINRPGVLINRPGRELIDRGRPVFY